MSTAWSIRPATLATLCVAVGLGMSGCGVARTSQQSDGTQAHFGVSVTGVPTHAPAVINAPNLPCALQTDTLLTQAELPVAMTPEFPAISQAGGPGLLDNGDAAYLGYVGDADAYFQWTGLLSGPPATMVAQAYAASGNQAPLAPGDLPEGGPLYTTYPNDVYQIAEATSDFGSVANAEKWMTMQRQDHPAEDVQDYGSGVERIPPVAPMGDDTFIYQIDDGAPNTSTAFTGAYVGHIYTDIEVRTGDVIFAVSLDSGSSVDSASMADSIVRNLTAKEQSVCG
jgi:hypothetical protein